MIWLLNLNVMLLVIHVLTQIQIIVVHAGARRPKPTIKTTSYKKIKTDQAVKKVVMMDIQPMELAKIQILKICIMNAQIVI